MTSASSAIELKKLTKLFARGPFSKKTAAVDELSCRFLEGKCTALLGHNGAGKTTSIRMILGLVRPDAGEILFFGKTMNNEDRAEIGYVPENNKLADCLSCEEVLFFHLRMFRPRYKIQQIRDIIKERLHAVGLVDAAKKHVGHLSKGMARRLAWAVATSHDPAVYLLDEPYSGLDPVARFELTEWTKDLKRRGKTVIVCTHELTTVRELADEVHIFQRGKLAYSTTDKGAHDRPSALNKACFQLVISGIRNPQEDLKTLSGSYRLGPYISATQRGHNLRLLFSEYEIASQWMRAALQEGLIILRFADEIAIEDESLRVLFDHRATTFSDTGMHKNDC